MQKLWTRCIYDLVPPLKPGHFILDTVVNIEKERGIMCESCGYIYPMDRQEYKEARDKVKKAIDK